jgi:ACS family pantothenate transporter-like MFS transporter
LRVWRVADSPTYPIGFPLATAFAAGGIVSLFAIYLYVRRNSWILEYGLSGRDAVEDDLSPVEYSEEKKDSLDASHESASPRARV